MHNGGTNVRLNVHLGMSGLSGSRMIVAGEAKEWSAEKTITFDVCPQRPHAAALSPHADLRPLGRLRSFGRDGQAEEEGQGEEGASGGAGGGDYSP